MSPERWERAGDLFAEIVELDREARADRLAEIRQTDPDLHDEVRSLLKADDEVDARLVGVDRLVDHLEFEPLSDPIPRLNAALEGRYALEKAVGEGGMSTVFLADDLKHERKVALKVLRPVLARAVGAERFLSEIKTTARLQHPGILPLYDSGQVDEFLFYVMPYVEGESLRDRLDREQQLPVDEAVRIAVDVAEALAYAHEQGVVHRDIKPANVLLQGGRPVVADFGIALALQGSGNARLTETGLRVGTPHYMSPEQALGDSDVDPATDTYSLGCLLYESLVGDPPFTGRSPQSVFGRVLKGTAVPAADLRPSVPPHVDAAIRKALEKAPVDRFARAEDFSAALSDPDFRYGPPARPAEGVARARRARTVAASVAATLFLVAMAAGLLGPESDDSAMPEIVRFSVDLGVEGESSLGGEGRPNGRSSRTSIALSPDGTHLAYTAIGPDGGGLYLHRLDREHPDRVAGVGGGAMPFFSPDGSWLGFFERGALRRVPVEGGPVETIVQTAMPRGASWGDDETIVLGHGRRGLFRVSAEGGEAESLFTPSAAPGERVFFAQPHVLPGSRAVLYHVSPSFDPSESEIEVIDLATGARKTLLTNGTDPRYVSTGHLLFMRDGTLWAVVFDAKSLEVRGDPVLMIDDVMHSIATWNTRFDTGAGEVAVSTAGHLAYARGGIFPRVPTRPVRITQAGDTVDLDLPPDQYGFMRASPSGEFLAYALGAGTESRIWILDLARGVTQRLNTGGFSNWPFEWSPDSRSLAFTSDRDQARGNIYRIDLNGGDVVERLSPSSANQTVTSWSADGVIAWLEGDGIWTLEPAGEAQLFLETERLERYPTFSPDGRWLAYTANDPHELYVRPYPGPGPAVLVTDGGSGPAWSPDGRFLYYVQQGTLMRVPVSLGDDFEVGRPEHVLSDWTHDTTPVRGYDLLPDASFVTRIETDYDVEDFAAREVQVVLNWVEELRRRVPR